MFADHGPLLREVVTFNRCKVCVEIGVLGGKTTHELCVATKKIGGKVFGFDAWGIHGLQKQFKNSNTKKLVESMLKGRGHNNFLLTQINTMQPDFPSVLAKLCPTIDFAFIDGCHSYFGIKTDFDAVYPLLSSAGIVAFHDTLRIDGCREFILDLRTKYNDGTFDVIDFPWGLDSRRNGVSLLVKRSFPVLDLTLDEVCGSLSTPEEIYKREKEWFKSEQKKAQKIDVSLSDMVLENVGKI